MIILILLISIKVTCSSNTGSAIFYKRSPDSDCWSEHDIARLRARQIFEKLIPPPIAPKEINDKYIINTIRYFRSALKTAASIEDVNTAMSSKDLLADTIGSHMRSEILPTARFAYYSGYISYKRIRELHDFYNNLKMTLNTQGIGWKAPDRVPKWQNLTIEKIRIGAGKYVNPCGVLITKRDSRSCIHLPAPIVDDKYNPSAVLLPFKTGGLLNLESSKSENVLLKYYMTASRCILRNSPVICRHTDFVTFNKELWQWLKRDVAPHLVDEKLYASFGGVLRIAAAVQGYGQGLSRRNLFESQDGGVSKWRPWKAITETYVYMNDSKSYLYVLIVLAIAITICLLQVFYGYIFNDDEGCHCQRKPAENPVLEYANVDSNLPALLPSDRSQKCEPINNQPPSVSSIRTQKVYNVQENKEKVMAVIVSDSEVSSKYSLESVSSGSEESNPTCQSYHKKKNSERSISPPKIDTLMSEVKLTKKRLSNVPQMSVTTSVVSESNTYLQEGYSSSTGSTTSGETSGSISSKTSKSCSLRSRSLAWAQRVAAKNKQVRSTSGTDYKSFTTPP